MARRHRPEADYARGTAAHSVDPPRAEPRREVGWWVDFATAVCAKGILIGETLPTVLTTPVGVLPLAHGDWRWAIASWSALVLGSAIAIVAAAPARTAGSAARPRWWPDWRQGQAIRIGLVMGMASAAYFGANAFIPDFLAQTGRHDLTSPPLRAPHGRPLPHAPAVPP